MMWVAMRSADYGLTPRDRPKLFVLCSEAPRAALLEREAGLVGTLANAERVPSRAIMRFCIERLACRVHHTLPAMNRVFHISPRCWSPT